MSFLTEALEKFRAQKETRLFAKMINGQAPIFSQFGDNIFASDVVQQAVYCIVTELKKLRPQHIKRNGTDVTPVSGPYQMVLDNPNPYMTTSEFIEKLSWMLLLNYNAFILKTYSAAANGAKTLNGLWPLKPQHVTFEQTPTGDRYIKFLFGNGLEYEVPQDDVIHLRYKYSVNEFMGGDEQGQPDNRAILQTVSMNDKLLQSVSKGLQYGYATNGMLILNGMLNEEAVTKSLNDLEARLRKGESGIVPLDAKAEFRQLNRNVKLVDKDTLEFVDSKILRNWGVPLPILTGDFNPEQMAAFYQKTLEPIIIGMSQSFTKSLFTPREALSFGNEIQFYSEELIFMDTSQKLEMVRLLGDSGALYENEKRTIFGMPPLTELTGIRRQSLNYVDSDIAVAYQLGLSKKGQTDQGAE